MKPWPFMRIGIDGRKLHDFGIGTYLQNLLKELVRLDDDAEYVVLCRAADVDWLAALGPRIHPVVTHADNYTIREQIEVPWRLWRAGVALFHSPHYVLPVLVPCPAVVTVHDCIHLMFPQYLPNRLAIYYARFFMSQALRNEDVTVFGDGSQTRSFCYVSDLVRGIIKLLESSENDPVNIGNPHEMTILEIAETIIRMVD